MIRESDKLWLARKYPTHKITEYGIACTVTFTAIYNEETNQFLILDDVTVDTVGGIKLSGTYAIRIMDVPLRTFSRLPAVYVDDVEDHQMDRHFYQTPTFDACLCSPFEEERFLSPDFDFKLFFEQLVIPFLYGQRYFDEYECWPWDEYSHGSIGLLESYFNNETVNAKECVSKLFYSGNWKIIKPYLEYRGMIKGHIDCFCGSKDQIRRCHPKAWKGIRKLKDDLLATQIVLPQ